MYVIFYFNILLTAVRRLEGNASSGADFLSGDELSSDVEDALDQSDFSRRSKKMKTFHA